MDEPGEPTHKKLKAGDATQKSEAAQEKLEAAQDDLKAAQVKLEAAQMKHAKAKEELKAAKVEKKDVIEVKELEDLVADARREWDNAEKARDYAGTIWRDARQAPLRLVIGVYEHLVHEGSCLLA